MARILIAGARKEPAEAMQKALEEDDYSVILCDDGLSAMREIARCPVDLVVSDAALAGMGTFDLVQALEDDDSTVPTIVLQTEPGGEDVSAESWVWMGEPIGPNQLRKMVAGRLATDSGRELTGRVLVVDDDSSLRTSLHVRLRLEGMEVIEAIDGLEALERLKDSCPDIVLTDVDMPRLDGFGLVKEMRTQPETRSVPVIVMTAHAKEAEEAAYGLELGASDYVRKPFEWLELTARVRTQIRVRQAHRLSVEKQRDLAIIELAGAAAHEINNPLAVGFARIELMMEAAEGDDTLKKDLVQIENLFQRIADVVQKMGKVRRYQAEHYCGGVNILDLDGAGEE